MFEIKALIRVFDKGFLLRSLHLLLLVSLIPIAEIALFLYLVQLIGIYLTFAALLATGLLGFLTSYGEMRRTLSALKEKVREGRYPTAEFANLAGALVGSLFLVTPGFISDVIGVVVFFPAVRRHIGRTITGKMEPKMKEIYEYLKMYDL